MGTKTKGSTAERELVHLLWAKGFAAVRVAGSGSTSFPAPDVLCGKNGRVIAFECKSVSEGVRYIPKAEITQLQEFSKTFGAECFLAVRYNRKEWHFLLVDEIKDKATLKLSVDEIKLKGLLLDEII